MNGLGIGARLRNARQARGLSLEDVAAATRIRRPFLEALEVEAFERLPAPVYVKWFLGGYASYLGFSQDEIQEMHRDLADRVSSTEEPVDVRITPVTPQPRIRRRVLMIGLLVVAGLLYFSYVAYVQFRQFAAAPPPQPPAISENGPAAPPPAPSTGAPPRVPPSPPGNAPPAPPRVTGGAPAPAPPSPATVFASPLVVAVEASDRSWVRAVADGVTVFEGFLSAGDHQVWQANHSLSLRVGNASALSLTVDGQSLGRLGKPGDVVDRVFTAGPQ